MPDTVKTTSPAHEPTTGDEVPTQDLAEEVLLTSAPIAEATRPKFGIIFWICIAWLALLAFVTIFANHLHLKDPLAQLSLGPNAPASKQFWLGTDEDGRDILSRLIYGARVSLVIGLGATAIAVGIGGFLGMLSAYLRGWFDAVLSYFMYCGLAFPALIAVLAILEFWGHTEEHIILVLGLFGVPLIFRVVRAATLACATKEYVTAAKSQGATAIRVLLRDIFPNVAPALIAYTVFTFGGVITVEGALGFLGQSVAQPEASWGNMIQGASSNATNVTYVLAPTVALFCTLVALNIVGEKIRVHFDTGEQKL